MEQHIPGIVLKDGLTQPVFDYKRCLFEKVYVETPVDTDGDGRLDLIAVYIRRPLETTQGMRVPAIYVANPYMLECNEDWYVPHDVDRDVSPYPQQHITESDITFDPSTVSFPQPRYPRATVGYADTAPTEEIPLDCISDWYSYFNSRGYASVFCGGLGTRGSQGFNCCGSPEETAAFKAVIDWLNGRCRAFTNLTDNIEIRADWCTGKVAMSGKSYLGTMCIAVASTGVEGLETIIPEAAISNWYDYYRCNGLNLPAIGWQGDDLDILAKYCFSRAKDPEDYASVREAYAAWLEGIAADEDRDSGNYSRWWDMRNYLKAADRFKASVFLVHGLADWNVKPTHCVNLFAAMECRGIPCKMMLHQGGHIYIHDLQGSRFNEMLHLWLDHWLYGIENGAAERIPNVLVQSNLDQDLWLASPSFPAVKGYTEPVLMPAQESGRLVDDLSATVYDRTRDNAAEWLAELVLSERHAHCLRYITAPLKTDTRISGTIQVSFRAACRASTAILSAMLVELGEECRLTPEQEVVQAGGIPWGNNTPLGDWKRFRSEEKPSAFKVISRGWMNAQNRRSHYCKDTIEPGVIYDYQFSMVPMDHTVRAGRRLCLVLYGTDVEATQRPFAVTELSVEQDSVRVAVPMAPVHTLRSDKGNQ